MIKAICEWSLKGHFGQWIAHMEYAGLEQNSKTPSFHLVKESILWAGGSGHR